MHCYKSCWLLSVSESPVAPDPTLVITQVATEAVLSGVEQTRLPLRTLGCWTREKTKKTWTSNLIIVKFNMNEY